MAGNVEEFLRRAIQQKLGKRFEEVEVLSTDELQPIPAANVPEDGAPRDAGADRVSQRGQEVGLAEERLEDHLHAAFDHQVGALQHEDETDSDSRKSSESAPQGLRQLFQSKSALRNAIIFREIIDRPADRW